MKRTSGDLAEHSVSRLHECPADARTSAFFFCGIAEDNGNVLRSSCNFLGIGGTVAQEGGVLPYAPEEET